MLFAMANEEIYVTLLVRSKFKDDVRLHGTIKRLKFSVMEIALTTLLFNFKTGQNPIVTLYDTIVYQIQSCKRMVIAVGCYPAKQ